VSLLTLAVADVILRRLSNSPVYQMALPAMPLLSRYHANVTADEIVVGDLGAATADSGDDEARRVRTSIDSAGFRNDEDEGRRVVDVVVVGDSFGFGLGTTQEQVLSSQLRDRFALSTYNLSMPWTGPWAQFVNLSMESKRLTLREGGSIVWVLFTGNDLDDRYGELDVDSIPRNGLAGQWWISAKRVRNRSPLYRMLGRARRNLFGAPASAQVIVVIPTSFVDGRTLLFLKPWVAAGQRSYEQTIAHPNYPALQQTVTAMKELAGRLKVSLNVVLAPTKEEVYRWVLDKGDPWTSSPEPSGFGTALGEISAGAGVAFLDLKPAFITSSKELFERSGKLLWWYDDSHWNDEGQALAASLIHRELLARQGDPVPRTR
jgi:hypothetical protein